MALVEFEVTIRGSYQSDRDDKAEIEAEFPGEESEACGVRWPGTCELVDWAILGVTPDDDAPA